MKLLRFGKAGQEKPGILDSDGNMRDLSAHLADISGDALGDEALGQLAKIDLTTLPLVKGNPRLGPRGRIRHGRPP